ncbi:tetratricopeptide repeat protein [Mariniphaga sediminis]|jgi:tetratricopeptide (TPR) repeat protein|uniref:Tetratricopeptide repeat protein n=1 Tax=Mariniphaga sediminis TaxID=1628158 RepID=A0A399D0E1_9BACT|nr:tetratricopeptide repeat protein [Mariniphaga sediminis]RIH64202.1 tetratricopeptide repeat protein [Mariniphaga sediminis]RIH66481.1 tetratricopeptide repeat protein [Mariniphaga sediminis]
MNKEERHYFGEENINEALSRFKRSLASGRKSYFDVSEFEGIVEYLLDEGDINTSEIAARQGIQIHPGAVPLQLKYAQVLLSKGKYQNALKYLDLAEQVELTNPDVHLMKGSAWLVLGEEREAERSFRKALKYSGVEKDDILYHIGAAYVQSGDIKKAIQYFERSLKLNPENEMALYDLGFFSDQEGEYQKSIDYYNRYLDIDPFNFSIWFNLGISYNKAGEFEKAVEAYEFAMALNEDFDQSLFNIGNAYANAGKYEEAIKKYTEYLEFDPENDDAWCYIGECYLNLDDHDQAEHYYQKAIKLNEENDTAWFGVGLIKWVEKKWKESIGFIKKALDIDDSNTEYWITLAKVYNDNNRPIEAEKALVKAADLEAGNTEVWLTWVDIFLKFGELENALRVLESGLEKSDDSLLKYRMVSLLLESKREKEAFAMLEVAMEQEFTQIKYLFDVYPKALKNKRLRKIVDDFEEANE